MVDADSRELISPLVFPGSLGAGSYNTQFAGLAAASIEANGGTVDSGTMGDFDCPSYNADTRDFGFATGTEESRCRLEAVDAFVISSPEYNASLPRRSRHAPKRIARRTKRAQVVALRKTEATPERWPR